MSNSFQAKLNQAIQESNRGNQNKAIKLLLECEKQQIEIDYVYLNLANCYIKKNDDDNASQYLGKILNNKPRDAQILLNLNKLALGIYRFDLAIKACEIAETISPQSADVIAALIQAKKEVRNRSGIKSLCKRIISLLPDNSWSYSQLGYNYLTKGKFNKAQKAFQKARTRDPNSSFVYAGLVKAVRNQQRPKVLIKNINQAISNNSEGESKARLYLAKAKVLNDCGEYEQAWNSAVEGKNIKASLSVYQPEKFNHYTESIINYYSDKETHAISDNLNAHVCIVGMPRSGTTLIEQILSTYKEFYPGGETPALDNAFYQQFKGESYLQKKNIINAKVLSSMAENYESFFSRFSNYSGSRIIDKIPMHFLHIGMYLQLFPNAKIINFHRNKYDVSTSILFENFSLRQNFTHNIKDIFSVYDSYQKLMNFWGEMYPDSIITVEYSQFVAQHSKVKKQIMDFVGVAASSELDYKSSRNAIETPSVWQARQPIYRSSVDRWKRYPQMVKLVKEDHD